ncbi:hypothetical protein BKA93DRAFT_192970 [Sparassis latifolia]
MSFVGCRLLPIASSSGVPLLLRDSTHQNSAAGHCSSSPMTMRTRSALSRTRGTRCQWLAPSLASIDLFLMVFPSSHFSLQRFRGKYTAPQLGMPSRLYMYLTHLAIQPLQNIANTQGYITSSVQVLEVPPYRSAHVTFWQCTDVGLKSLCDANLLKSPSLRVCLRGVPHDHTALKLDDIFE